MAKPEPETETGAGLRFPLPDYPWHQPVWDALTADFARLPHALLLAGGAGLGKHEFALRLAAGLLCAQPDTAHAACGRCHGCQLLAAGTHPDLMLVAPEEDRRGIVIDQVRALGAWLALRPHTAARKVAVLVPADGMTLNAANSLLKILEEPPLGSVLLLVASQPERLPATVRSRCRRVPFTPPARETALAWLRGQEGGEAAEALLDVAAGAPLRARALARDGFVATRATLVRDLGRLLEGDEDPVACAQRWKALGAEACVDWLSGVVANLIRVQLVPGMEPTPAELQNAKNVLNLNILFSYIDVVSNVRNGLASSALDETLLLEDLLISWCRLGERRPTIRTGTQ